MSSRVFSPDVSGKSTPTKPAAHSLRQLAKTILPHDDRNHLRALLTDFRRSNDLHKFVGGLSRLIDSNERLPLVAAVADQMPDGGPRERFLEQAAAQIPLYGVSQQLSRAASRLGDGSEATEKVRRISFISAKTADPPERRRSSSTSNSLRQNADGTEPAGQTSDPSREDSPNDQNTSAIGERVQAELNRHRSRPSLESLQDKGFWNKEAAQRRGRRCREERSNSPAVAQTPSGACQARNRPGSALARMRKAQSGRSAESFELESTEALTLPRSGRCWVEQEEPVELKKVASLDITPSMAPAPASKRSGRTKARGRQNGARPRVVGPASESQTRPMAMGKTSELAPVKTERACVGRCQEEGKCLAAETTHASFPPLPSINIHNSSPVMGVRFSDVSDEDAFWESTEEEEEEEEEEDEEDEEEQWVVDVKVKGEGSAEEMPRVPGKEEKETQTELCFCYTFVPPIERRKKAGKTSKRAQNAHPSQSKL